MSLNIVSPFKNVIGGWKEIGRTVLGATNVDIDVTGLPDKRYLQFLCHIRNTATNDTTIRLNGDSALNYAVRLSQDAAVDQTLINQPQAPFQFVNSTDKMIVGYISNLATKEKMMMANLTETTPTFNARGIEWVAKWANTADAVNQFTMHSGAGSYATGSEVIILGWDPADTHTSNFWVESPSSTILTSPSSNVQLNVGAHKWYWIQAYIKPTATLRPFFRIANDSGQNYGYSFAENGGAPIQTSTANEVFAGLDSLNPQFINIFLNNYDTRQKGMYIKTVDRNILGSGFPGTQRSLCSGAYSPTTQFTEIDFVPSTSTFATGSTFKVWFAD